MNSFKSSLRFRIGVATPIIIRNAPDMGSVTSVLSSLAVDMGLCLKCIDASEQKRSNIIGSAKTVGDYFTYEPPVWAKELVAARNGILFFGNMSAAEPDVRRAIIRVMFERRIGELKFPPGIAVVVTEGELDSLGDYRVPAFLAVRTCRFNYPVSVAVG